jgi:hypothetical protein
MNARNRPALAAYEVAQHDPLMAYLLNGSLTNGYPPRPHELIDLRGDGTSESTPANPATNSPQLTAAPTPTGPGGPTIATARHNGAGLLVAASCLLLLLAAAQGYVSFRAQYAFVDHAKRARLPSTLEALGLDTGAVIFALLALSLARSGQRGTVERALNVACALGSLTMNLLAADLASPRSVTVWVLPSALYALASDRLIAVVRRWALASDPADRSAQDRSAWRGIGGLALWLLRLLFDAPGTVAGFRRWVLTAAPVAPGIRAAGMPAGVGVPLPAAGSTPERPGLNGDRASAGPSDRDQSQGQTEQPAHDANQRPGLAPGETKRDALIRLYEHYGQKGDRRYGDPAKSAALASEIASQIGYHPGTARRELARHLAAIQPKRDPRTKSNTPTPEPDPEAVA